MFFLGVREQSVNSGASRIGEIVSEEGGVEPFRQIFFWGSALDNSSPRGARYGLAGFREIVGKGGLDQPAVIFSWLVVVDSKVGHWAFFVSSFLEVRPFGLPGAGNFGRPYQGSS